MWMMNWSLLVILVVLVTSTEGGLVPGFSRYRANAENSGVMIHDGPTQYDESWLFRTNISTGDFIDNSAVIGSNGDMYFAISQTLFCVSKNGERRWRYRSDGLFSRSTAAVTEDKLYIIGSNYQWGSSPNDGFVMAFNPSNGKLLWKYKLNRSQYGSVNVMENGNILTVSNGISVLCLSPNGNKVWEYEDSSHGMNYDEMTPAINHDGSIIYGASGGYLRSLSSKGEFEWELAVSSKAVIYSPSIGDDGNIYMSAQDGSTVSVYCVSPDGSVKWKYSQMATHGITSATYFNGNVYVVVDSYLHSLREGKSMWNYYFYDSIAGPYKISTAPVIAKNGMLYLGAWWWVYGFDITNTELDSKPPRFAWRYKATTYAATTLNQGPAPTVGAEGTLYVGFYNILYAVGKL